VGEETNTIGYRWSRFVQSGLASVAEGIRVFNWSVNDAYRSSPQWVGGWCYVVLAAGMVTLVVGGLLVSTLLSVAAGDTYIEQLTRKSKAGRDNTWGLHAGVHTGGTHRGTHGGTHGGYATGAHAGVHAGVHTRVHTGVHAGVHTGVQGGYT
jgi:hypothetical protein